MTALYHLLFLILQQHLNEGAKQMAVLNSAIGALDRARRAYERAARESERALDAFQRADADLNLRLAVIICCVTLCISYSRP